MHIEGQRGIVLEVMNIWFGERLYNMVTSYKLFCFLSFDFFFYFFLQNKQLSIVRLLVLTWLCQQGKSFFPWK